jgi:predicted ATP-grasp superfamily ATP-dependent carboligase
LLRQFDHPNIVKIHDVIEDETKVYCVIDNIKGPSLFQYVLENKQVSIAHTVTVAAQILSVIAYMHKRDFVLRRINMETVFLSDANKASMMKVAISSIKYCARKIISAIKSSRTCGSTKCQHLRCFLKRPSLSMQREATASLQICGTWAA